MTDGLEEFIRTSLEYANMIGATQDECANWRQALRMAKRENNRYRKLREALAGLIGNRPLGE